LGNFTTRLCVWLSAGGRCLLDRLSILRLARPVRGRSAARISRAVHSGAGARVAGLAAAAAREKQFLERSVDCTETPLGSLSLRHFVDDGVQRHVSWDPGHVSNFSWRAAPLWRYGEGRDRNHLCFWSDLRRNTDGSFIAKMGPPPLDYFDCRIRNNPYSLLGFFAGLCASCHRRICDAIHGAGRLGNRTDTFE